MDASDHSVSQREEVLSKRKGEQATLKKAIEQMEETIAAHERGENVLMPEVVERLQRRIARNKETMKGLEEVPSEAEIQDFIRQYHEAAGKIHEHVSKKRAEFAVRGDEL